MLLISESFSFGLKRGLFLLSPLFKNFLKNQPITNEKYAYLSETINSEIIYQKVR